MDDLRNLEKQSVDAFLAGDYVKSRDLCYQLIRIAPNDPRYYTHMAECFQRLGDPRQAQDFRARAQSFSAIPATDSRRCPGCGLPVSEQSGFCGGCGAKIPPPVPQAPPPMYVPPPPPPRPPMSAQAPAPRSGGAKNAVISVLVVALIVLGAFFGVYANNLTRANKTIDDLRTSVTSLEQQLTAEQANVASLQTQLTAAQAQVTSLTGDLASASARVTSLTSDLAAANTKVAATQASLDKAAADLAAATLANTSQAAEIKKVEDPKHFATMTELNAWLAKDDTNTNAAYAGLSSYSKAFILQVRALRDGYLLPACLDWDASFIYSWNAAVVGGQVVSVNAATDVVTAGPTFGSAPPTHPLPIP
jgi:peptidoglycan hydrolase CwlO-like protein